MPSPSEQLHLLHSTHLNNERSIWVRTPRTGEPPHHLVVFLDAEIYRENVKAVEVIDRLIETDKIPSAIFVFVSALDMETRAIECPCHPPFARFVIDELMPWLEREEPAIKHCDQRTLVGLSYTGLAAAYVALQAPDAFTRIIAQSGSFWWNHCWLVNQYAHLKTRLPVAFYLDVGNKETRTNIDHGHVQQAVSQIDAVIRFRDVLTHSGHTVNYVEFDGHHDAAQWRQTLPNALKWALAES